MQDGFTDHEVSGLLLYARTTDEIQPDGDFSMSGNKISVKTLDLNQPFEVIAKQLNQIAEEQFGISKNEKNNSVMKYSDCGQRCSFADSGKINCFARKWREKFIERSRDIEENIFADECFALGFKTDMGESLKSAFPEIQIEKPENIRTVIGTIDDVAFLGTAIFSYWRWRCKLEWGAINDDETREWMLIAFERLIEITKD